MKELSIEEKAKRYDKAFIKSREFLTLCEKCGAKDTVEFIEDIFPELKMDKESEDERIRKEILDYIDKATGCKRWVAWLEQQGKPVEINPTEFDLQLNKLLVQFESLSKEELASSLSFYLNVVKNGYLSDNVEPTDYNSIDPHFGEPVDKVEPKFKVGDWCIDNEDGTIFQIVKVLDKTYRYRTNKGKEYSCAHYSLGLDARLWTIQDAKDGDILHSTGFHNDCIFIFNGLDNWKFDEPNGDRAVATGYCFLSVSADNMEFGMQGPDCVEVSTVKPATKIQRNLLFRKIKEAGYKWDADKKELKKIGHKPTWSDEDESNFQGIIDELKANKHHAPDSDLPTYDSFLSWFKSLKERYFWKPSDEQIDALEHFVRSIGESGFASPYDDNTRLLYSLLEQLKKL